MKLLTTKHLAVGSAVKVLLGERTIGAEVRYSEPRPMGQCEVGLQTARGN